MRCLSIVLALTLVIAPITAQADDGAIQITFHGAIDNSPDWSPDGSQIAFSSRRSGNYALWVIPSEGGVATQLTYPTGLHAHYSPSWSPDGSQIVYCHYGWESFRLDVMPFTPGGVPTEICYGENPDWSPVSDLIAYDVFSNIVFNYNISAIRSYGSGGMHITLDPDDERGPSWSPDGSRIAYWSNRSGNYDIWTIPVDSGLPHPPHPIWVTSHPADDLFPCWSPDGSRIAFTSNRSGNNDIWIVPSGGGGSATQITSDRADDSEPSWSPDGRQIAFTSRRSGNHDIWVIDVEPPVTVEQESWGMVKSKYHE